MGNILPQTPECPHTPQCSKRIKDAENISGISLMNPYSNCPRCQLNTVAPDLLEMCTRLRDFWRSGIELGRAEWVSEDASVAMSILGKADTVIEAATGRGTDATIRHCSSRSALLKTLQLCGAYLQYGSDTDERNVVMKAINRALAEAQSESPHAVAGKGMNDE